MARKRTNQQVDAGATGRIRAMGFGAMLLMSGLVGSVVLAQLVNSYETQIAAARAAGPTVDVVIAVRTLYQGIAITEDDLKRIRIPPEFLPGGSAEGVYLHTEELVGRMPSQRILRNEFIQEARLSDPETGSGLNALIPTGMRAISIDIDHAGALSGFLQPGNCVDVVVTLRPTEARARSKTLTLLESVTVLAVNDRTKIDGQNAESRSRTKQRPVRYKPSVTMSVFPDQAEAIVFAAGKGKMTLTLGGDCSMAERGVAETEATELDDIVPRLESDEAVVIRKPPPRIESPKAEQLKRTLTLIRGSKVTVEEVD